jgi:mannose-1-phosphate guanylyltransferase
MDHLREGVVVPGEFPWADLGTWDSWARQAKAGGQAIAVQGRNVSVISLEPHLVATVGLSDVVVVHTPTATLVCAADKAQAVREVVRRVQSGRPFAAYR